MTTKDVDDRVEEIRQSTYIGADAHLMEDELHKDVLRAIANGADNPSGLASHALRTLDIEFNRNYMDREYFE